jgi:hypothetical protein
MFTQMARRYRRGSGLSLPFVRCLISAGFSASGQCYRVPGMPLYLCFFSLSFGSGQSIGSANPCLKALFPVSSLQQGSWLRYDWWLRTVSTRVVFITL